jgi:iron complex transport system permease protein
MDTALEKTISAVRSRNRTAWVVPTLFFILFVSILLGCAYGAANVSISDIVNIVLHKLGVPGIPVTWRPADETIIFQLRLPRVLGAVLVGAALSSAGVIFQGLLRNPLADPYIIGTSAGAAFMATVAMLLPVSYVLLDFGLVALLSFAGAVGTVFLVYRLARTGGRTPVVNLLLSGVIVAATLTAFMTFLISTSERFGLNLHSVYSFLMGRFAISSWEQIIVLTPLIAAGIALTRLFSRHLNAFALGEDGAAYLGVSVERDKIVLLVTGALLTASAVALSGLVGFVGLVVPHAVRIVLGPDHQTLVPVSALAGAVFLVLCDLVSRTVLAPVEIPVGVITAIIGAPFFIYLLKKTGKKYTF